MLRRHVMPVALLGAAFLTVPMTNSAGAFASAEPRCADAPDVAPTDEPVLPPIRWATYGPDWPIALGVEGDLVTAVGEVGDVAAYDARTGSMLWSTPPYGATADEPRIGAHIVAAAVGPTVMGLDRSDGHEVWQHEIDPRGALALVRRPDQEVLVVIDDSPRLTALDMTSGDELWKVGMRRGAHTTVSVNATPGIVVATIRMPKKTEYLALEPVTGTELWRVRAPAGSEAPIFGPGVVVLPHAGRHPRLVARDVNTGATRWTAPLGSSPASLMPHSDGSHGVLVDQCGSIVLVDAIAGRVVWQTRMSDVSSRVRVRLGTRHVLVADGSLIVWLDRATGRVTRTADVDLLVRDLRPVGDSVVLLSDIQLTGVIAVIDWATLEAASLH